MKKKKNLLSLIALALVVIVASLYIVKESNAGEIIGGTKSLGIVALWDNRVDTTILVVRKLDIYSKKEDKMIPVEINYDDKKALSELIHSSKISKNPVRKPTSTTLIADMEFKTSDQTESGFKLYKKKDNYFIRTHPDVTSGEVEWYQLEGYDLPKFFVNLLEKNTH